MSSPCVYGQCSDLISAFQCRCQTGYNGIHCDNGKHQTSICEMPVAVVVSISETVSILFQILMIVLEEFAIMEQHVLWVLNLCHYKKMFWESQSDIQDLLNAFTCTCAPGYTGRHCTLDINECRSTPCQNGGTCLNQVDQFSCICRDGFTGVTCQVIHKWKWEFRDWFS